jgi:hypothetical protein
MKYFEKNSVQTDFVVKEIAEFISKIRKNAISI